jgi:REP element-mobilizing transposase RayT
MTKYDPHKHHRRSIRLKGYDYSQPGYYFVTICVQDRISLFGACSNGVMQLSAAGEMIVRLLLSLIERFPTIKIESFVVMPNHIHFIIEFVGAVGATLVVAQDSTNAQDAQDRAGTRPAPTKVPTLGVVVGAFKSITTHQYTIGVEEDGWPMFNGRLWQRNYYEHIIRNGRALNAIREYINNNPLLWEQDVYHPHAAPNSFNSTSR